MDCKPIRLLFPWDFPGKNTGVGCHFLLQGIFWCRDWTHISCIAGRFFTAWATRKAPNRLTVECKHNFYMHWETKNFPWLASLWYSLYCGHLAPNPRHLRGLPVPSSPTPLCPACPLFYPLSVFGGGRQWVSISLLPRGQQHMMVGHIWKKRKKRLIFNDSFRYY